MSATIEVALRDDAGVGLPASIGKVAKKYGASIDAPS